MYFFRLLSKEEGQKEIILDHEYNQHCTESYKKFIGVKNKTLEEHLIQSVTEPSNIIKENINKSETPSLISFLSQFFKPQQINIIITDGSDNIGAPYTLANNIIIPDKYHFTGSVLGYINPHLLIHESWHILSRNNPEIRKTAYQIFDFIEVKNLNIIEKLKKINYNETDYFINPDSIFNNFVYPIYNEDKKFEFYILTFLGKQMIPKALTFDKNFNVEKLTDLNKIKQYSKDFNIPYNSSIEEICAELFRMYGTNTFIPQHSVKKQNDFFKFLNQISKKGI